LTDGKEHDERVEKKEKKVGFLKEPPKASAYWQVHTGQRLCVAKPFIHPHVDFDSNVIAPTEPYEDIPP
jgi:hypothetical protein